MARGVWGDEMRHLVNEVIGRGSADFRALVKNFYRHAPAFYARSARISYPVRLGRCGANVGSRREGQQPRLFRRRDGEAAYEGAHALLIHGLAAAIGLQRPSRPI